MYNLTSKIRDLINNGRRRYVLLKNIKLWNQLCSSLDVIEDSDLAITSYLNEQSDGDTGKKYLMLYGLLQALFLQQDAVVNLCESLGITYKLSSFSKLQQIRRIRNDSIGHPTKRGQYKSYHFISRPTISKLGFQLISNYDNKKTLVRSISLDNLIKEQKKYLSLALEKIIRNLVLEDRKHKEKFKMDKLQDIFPSTLSYHIEKVYENIGNCNQAQFAKINLAQVRGAITNLRKALQKRGVEIDTYDSVKYLYELLEYPIDVLEKYFDNLTKKVRTNINSKTAYIFVYFIKNHMQDLENIAKEIDKEYSETVN